MICRYFDNRVSAWWLTADRIAAAVCYFSSREATADEREHASSFYTRNKASVLKE